MRKTVVVGVALFCCVCLSHGISLEQYAQEEAPARKSAQHYADSDAYQRMAKELSESAELLANPKIAIMPFGYGDKKQSDAGTMVSERLTTRIVKVNKLKVIERQMLENVLQELHLEGTGVVDAETTKKIGKVLGVEAIITGTIMDLGGDTAEINARVIKTDSAEVIATSSAKIPRSWAGEPAPVMSRPVEYDRQARRRARTESSGPEAVAVTEATAVARQWLGLIDAGEYAKSYDGTSAFFKVNVALEKWVQLMETIRAPMGELRSRVFANAVYRTQLPGMADGAYVVMTCDTSFGNKSQGVETVTASKEKDGTWMIAGYYIK